MSKPLTKASVEREATERAVRQLAALQFSPPDVLRELAARLERDAVAHDLITGGVECRNCAVNRHAAGLFRAIATVRELTG
jgi:hypothetical protein